MASCHGMMKPYRCRVRFLSAVCTTQCLAMRHAPRVQLASFSASPLIPKRCSAFRRPLRLCDRCQKHLRMCRPIQLLRSLTFHCLLGQLVVIPPSFDVALPLLTQLLTGLALSRVPEFVYPFLESLDRSVSYLYRPFLVDPEPQESTLLCRPCSTLVSVDL